MTIISYCSILRIKSMNSSHQDKSVFSITMQLSILSAVTTVRFPCLFSVQWRTNNQKVCIETAKYSPVGSKTDFNEHLIIKTEVAYDRSKRMFLKRETQVQLNLTSKSRADQSKLVGRVTIDLASILNEGLYTESTEFPLQFCSVNASLLMSFHLLDKSQSDISVSQLELSYGDGLTLNSALKLVNSSHFKEKNKESLEISSEIPPVSKIRCEATEVFKKELSPNISPKSVESVNIKEIIAAKEPMNAMKNLRNLTQQKVLEQKPATRSFKNPNSIKQSMLASKKSEVTEDISQQESSKKSSFKKMSSINSEDGKISESGRLSEEITKQKIENEKLKQQGDRHRHEEDNYRLQLEKSKQECELLKLELKQKKQIADQASSDLNVYKAQLSKMREQNSKIREESVSLTLKVAEMRQSQSRSLVQSSVTERELNKLQGINEKYQELLRNRQEMLYNLNEYQSRCEQLEIEKGELQNTLNNLDQMHQQALSKCTENEEVLYESKGNFETQQRILKEHLKSETKEKLEYKLKIQQANSEIVRLTTIVNQFEEAKHSWNISQSLSKDEISRKGSRIKELEDNLISLDEKIRYLEGENELLTENCRKNREQYLSIKEEKQLGNHTNADLLKKYEKEVKQLDRIVNNSKEQKDTLQKQLNQVQESYLSLQGEYNSLKGQYENQYEDYQRISTNLLEVEVKNHQLEELVLNINELRDREQVDSANKERNFIIQIAENEGNNHQLSELLQASSERIGLIEQELKGRQNLIIRLQEGLKTQVERSEDLNNRVMYYIEKEERMKETVLLIELQSKKVNELLADLDVRQAENQQRLLQKESRITELATNLQQSVQYSRRLEETIKTSQSSSLETINKLSKEVEKKCSEITQLKQLIQGKSSKLKQLQSSYSILKQKSFTEQSQNLTVINDLKNTISNLENSKIGTEGVLAIQQSQLQNLQNQLSSKQQQLSYIKFSLEKQTIQYETLCQQLKENEKNNENQILIAEERYLQLSNKLQELESQSILKQQQHQQLIHSLQQNISELKFNLETVTNENVSFNIAFYKDEIKKKKQEISLREVELKNANIELSKIPNLQRSLKIKTIELNSLKFKGKIDGSDGNELLRLKDQEILSLTAEKDRLQSAQQQLQELKEKCDALATELELLEEEKFNIQSLSNERVLQFHEARDENRKLMDEITIIGERNGELQRMIQDLLSKDTTVGSQFRGEKSLMTQNFLLKNQLKELQHVKSRNHQLEQSRQMLQQDLDMKEGQHMLALIDQQIKLVKNDTNGNAQTSLKKSLTMGISESKQIPNLASTYKSLKEIIDLRIKNQNSEKMIEMIQSILTQVSYQDEGLLSKTRLLSKEFQKMKVQIMRGDGRVGQQKTKLTNFFRVYETMLSDVIRVAEGGKS